jgi:hypothetical protein
MIRLGTEGRAAGVRRRRPRAPTYPTPAAMAERPRLARPKQTNFPADRPGPHCLSPGPLAAGFFGPSAPRPRRTRGGNFLPYRPLLAVDGAGRHRV